MSLRAIPGLTVLRPADANECAAAWSEAVKSKGPVAMALTRQKLEIIDPEKHKVSEGVQKGAYILSESNSEKPKVILIATGSEVQLAMESQTLLEAKGISTRVVSMPSWELFEKQPLDYRKKVLLSGVPKIAIEAGATLGWYKYIGEGGGVIGLDRFGASAPGKTALEKLGFNVDNVVETTFSVLGMRG
jgi:transketolase